MKINRLSILTERNKLQKENRTDRPFKRYKRTTFLTDSQEEQVDSIQETALQYSES